MLQRVATHKRVPYCGCDPKHESCAIELPATEPEPELSATFIDVMIRRFRNVQFFPVALPEPKKKPSNGSAPSAPEFSAAPFVQPKAPVDYAALCRSVRDRSYFLWKEAGEPGGKAEEFWRQALDELLVQRARAIWERAGKPSGKDHDHWYEACRELERAGLL